MEGFLLFSIHSFCYNVEVRKKIILIIFSFLVFLTGETQAKTYISSPLSGEKIKKLQWRVEELPSLASFQLWQKQSNSQDWQELKSFSCQDENSVYQCQLELDKISSPEVRLKFIYPEESKFYLQIDRLIKEESLELEPNFEKEVLFYGPLKKIEQSLLPTSLSWQETNYQNLNQPEKEMPSKLLVQSRPMTETEQISPWSGNFKIIKNFSDQQVSNGNSLALIENIEKKVDQFVHFSYYNFDQQNLKLVCQQETKNENFDLPPTSQLVLTGAVASGQSEEEAFSNLSVTVNDLSSLKIGETILIQEIVSQQSYQIEGDIIDLQPSEKRIIINAWRGAIPKNQASSCLGQSFCFSTQARISKQQELFLPLEKNCDQLKLVSEKPLNLKVTNLYLGEISQPDCLKNDGDWCFLYVLDLQLPKDLSFLQYRLINFYPEQIKVDNVFLHQKDLALSSGERKESSSAGQTNFSRLRHGKKLDSSGITRAYYW